MNSGRICRQPLPNRVTSELPVRTKPPGGGRYARGTVPGRRASAGRRHTGQSIFGQDEGVYSLEPAGLDMPFWRTEWIAGDFCVRRRLPQPAVYSPAAIEPDRE